MEVALLTHSPSDTSCANLERDNHATGSNVIHYQHICLYTALDKYTDSSGEYPVLHDYSDSSPSVSQMPAFAFGFNQMLMQSQHNYNYNDIHKYRSVATSYAAFNHYINTSARVRVVSGSYPPLFRRDCILTHRQYNHGDDNIH